MRSHLRKIAIGAVLTGSLVAAMALPALADPPGLSIDTGNGARTVRVFNPDNGTQSVLVTIDTHLGFLDTGDSGPEYASPAARVLDGPGATDFQITSLRLRVNPSVPNIADVVENDLFPSVASSARENTPNGPGPRDACTATLANVFDGRLINRIRGASGGLFDTDTPSSPGCANAVDLKRTPTPLATVVSRGFQDWDNIGVGINGQGTVQSRVFLRVHWAATPTSPASTSSHTVLSNVAPYGP
jgi:hypothetical protein